MGHLLGLSSYLMWWNLGRRKPIPKDCLTLTACCEFSKIPPPRKLVLKYKYVGLLHIRDIRAETCFLITRIPRRPHYLPKLPPPSSSQTSPTFSCHYVPPMPCVESFHQQNMFQLTRKLASHTLSICLSSLITEMSQIKSCLDEMCLGGCILTASAKILEQPPRV